MSSTQESVSMPPRRSVILLVISTVSMVSVFIISIAKDFTLSTKELWSNDFQGFFLAAQLYTKGLNPYSISNQLWAYARYVPHFKGIGHVLFADAPLSLPLLHAFVDLPFRTGYLLLVAVEIIAFITGLLFAIGSIRPRALITCCILLGLPPVNVLVLTGQWDGIIVLGLGIHLFLMKRNRIYWSGFVLGITACIALPHLIFGYVIYFLVRLRKPAIISVSLGIILAGILSIMFTSTYIVTGFITSLLTVQSHVFETGFATILGRILPATVVDLLLAGCIIAVAIYFSVKANPEHYLPIAACVLFLNVLLNPHFFGQDLAIPLVAVAPLMERNFHWITSHVKQYIVVGICVVGLLALITTTQYSLLPLQLVSVVVCAALCLAFGIWSTNTFHIHAVSQA